jgi:carboxymethylenebutenolidase
MVPAAGFPAASHSEVRGGVFMGSKVTLTASDGFKLGGYRAEAQGTPKGALVLIQEIFGVNHHIRAMCDRFAAQGYTSVAPAVFDRMKPDFESGYSPDEIAAARAMMPQIDWEKMLLDVAAARDSVKSVGPVGIIGWCMGGSVAFLAAGKLDGFSASVGLYGGMIKKDADLKPKVPTQLHFGDQDQSIPMSDVEIVKQKRPDCEIYVYKDGGHGFHCDERGSFHKDSRDVAWKRTTDFFAKHMKK